MPLLDEIRAKRTEILAIADRCGLTDIKIFGSVARGEERPDSDVDFLVEVTGKGDPLGFVDFQQEVAAMVKRRVDVVFEKGLYHLLRDRIHHEAQPL